MTRIAGLPQTSSERAFDMLLKTATFRRSTAAAELCLRRERHCQQRRRNVYDAAVFANGNPQQAKAATLRFLGGNLRRAGDSDGACARRRGYRLNTRFARFINVPELMQIFCQVADIQTADKLKLPVPEMQTGKPMIVRASSTPELKEIVKGLVIRADASAADGFHHRRQYAQNHFRGRKAALDLRVLNPQAKDHPAANQSGGGQDFSNLAGHAVKPKLQLVFCDLSTPSKLRRQFCVYDDLKAKLVERGIPAEEIAFIQDYDSDVEKLALFKEVKSGKKRVLLGSTRNGRGNECARTPRCLASSRCAVATRRRGTARRPDFAAGQSE